MNEENQNIPENTQENQNKNNGQKSVPMASDIVFDKKREARIKQLEEKNASFEDKIEQLLSSKSENEKELMTMREFMKNQKVAPEANKTYWDSFNEYVQSFYKA